MYQYKVLSFRVIDGDTVDLTLDLGFNIYHNARFRLAGINAPEMRGESKEQGKESRTALLAYLKQYASFLEAHTEKDKTDKYGRYIVKLFGVINGSTLININEVMVSKGFAVEQQY